MVKTYPTKTQATKAKKHGQTTRQRKDGTWVCERPHLCGGKNGIEDAIQKPKDRSKK